MNVSVCRIRSICRTYAKFFSISTAGHYRRSLKHLSTVPCISFCSPQSIKFCSLRNRVSTVTREMATEAPSTSTDKGDESRHREPNRLVHERSPYLLQHAYNPVEWYPWREEAFEKARKENKLIFLSIGYSTCHWCHVMERESFENEDIAKIMNENFVNVKVDREERPDVDKFYMTFVQAISGHGGWPMSVFLTPDLHPVFGGTYYPPNDRYYGQPGFPSILKSLSKQWKENPGKFADSGKQILSVLEESASVTGGGSLPSAKRCSKRCFEQLQKSYEPRYGGFSQAPKFPQAVNFEFLLRLYAHPQTDERVAEEALEMLTHTLKMMAKGGIHDHVSTGFARYSTDKKWHVPHFEKMLYDQAQLAVVYADAYVATKDELFADMVRDILNYVSRDLSDPSGGFYSAEDADSYPEHGAKHKREGAFCVWTFDEVQQILSEPLEEKSSLKLADVLCHHFDIQPKGNVEPYQDPHDELKSQNVLIIRGSEEETATKFGLEMDVLKRALKRGLELLYEARQKRPRPHLDDKMIAAWNGLMISGFARAGAVLNDESYIQRAVKAAQFMEDHLYNASSGRLIRSTYRGNEGSPAQIGKPIDGFLDDYAFTIRGLLDLYEACQDDTWLQWAESLQNKQDELFWDSNAGAYFASPAGDPSILVRQKDDQDGAEPSGNSVSVSNLERLSSILDDSSFHDKAVQLLQVFSDRLEKIPIALPEMVLGLMLFEDSPTEVVIVGSKSSSETAALLHEAHVHQRLLSGRVIVLNDPSVESYLSHRRPSITSMKMASGQATAYVCRQRACSAPVTSVDDLRQLLAQ